LRARDIKTGHELFRINTEPAKHGIPLGNESSVVARIYDVCPLNSHEIAIIKHVGNYNQHSFLAVLDKDTGKETRRLDLDPNNLRGMHSTNYSHLFTAPTAHLVAVSMPTYHGPIIVSIYREQTLELMRTVTIQESDLDPTPYDYMQTDLKLSNDGRFFAVTCDSGHQDPILIYDTESGKRVGYYFGGNESYRSAVTFSPDGMFLIVASEINDVRSSTGFTSTSRLGLRLDIYDWANGRLSAQIKPDNSWDNFSSVIMLPSWEILAQLGDRILCFSLVTPH